MAHPSSLFKESAMRLFNGTAVNLAKVNASPEYQQLMLRLPNTPLHQRPLIPGNGRCAGSTRSQADRQLRKLESWDASSTSSASLRVLPSSPSTKTVQSTRATPSSSQNPPSQSSQTRDLEYAIDYVSLQSWLSPESSSFRILSESSAAFRARRYGLCQNYKHHYDCENEDYDLTHERVFCQFDAPCLIFELV